VNAGYKSAFFDTICCRHTGRLTSERNNKDIKNAYDLNQESQFRKVDPITKVVNLKRREDRKANMTKLFKEQEFTDYQFIEAFDGKTLYPTFEIWSLFRGNDFGNRLGVMGCALSHYAIWKSLLEDTSTDYYLILEDDITFTPHFKQKYEVLKEAFITCDYLLLGYSMFDRLRKATHDTYVTESENLRVSHLQKNLYVGGTFGYSINKNGAKILVDYIEKNGIKHGIDYVVKICPDLKPMEVRPQIIFAEWWEDKKKPIDTDIQTDFASLNFSKFETNFTFIQGVDQIGCDSYYHKKPVHECLDIALADPDCAGFNTLGFFKKSIDPNNLKHSNYFKAKDGIFVKKKVQKKPTVKIIGNWASSQTMAKETGTMPHPDVTLTWKDEADYYVILNIPSVEESYDPKKTIVFQMEPWVYDDKKRWGVKTWGQWANPDPKKFLHVHNRRFLNPATWTLNGDLCTFPVKQDDTCIILSHKKHDTGHKFRLDVVANGKVDVYGKENYHSLLNYQGPVPEDNRYNVYSKYKYVLAVENNSEVNYATEKIWEPLICECLPFYWGCPNIEEHLDPQCFVRLPTDPVKAAEIIQQAVKEDWWSQRIGAIREAKKKVMNEYGLFPVISKIIKEATTVQYYSQDGQDKYLDTNVFKSFKNGVFVDVGAHDGLSINNTIFFEKNRGWSGINVEPIKSVYDELTKNRPKSINLNYAVSNTDGNAEFICNEGYTEMISGLKDYFDPRHIKRLNNELNRHGGQTNVITVPTKRLETILDEIGIKHVHYLSIDVEGAEFEVVKSINFDKVFIDIIEFENNYNDNSIPIVNYLIEKGYSVIHRSMDIFMKHNDSKF
jgi:FkbM family methyltransferase